MQGALAPCGAIARRMPGTGIAPRAAGVCRLQCRCKSAQSRHSLPQYAPTPEAGLPPRNAPHACSGMGDKPMRNGRVRCVFAPFCVIVVGRFDTVWYEMLI